MLQINVPYLQQNTSGLAMRTSYASAVDRSSPPSCQFTTVCVVDPHWKDPHWNARKAPFSGQKASIVACSGDIFSIVG